MGARALGDSLTRWGAGSADDTTRQDRPVYLDTPEYDPRSMDGPDRLPARERLLAAASLLFHGHGIQATGIDAIIAEADVAKATFYRHFPSKDDLVIAWLRDPRTWWLDRVLADTVAHTARSPKRGSIPVFFEALGRWLEAENYRGCPYLNSAIEVTSLADPARAVVLEFLQAVEDAFTQMVEAEGFRNPRALARKLQALAAGAIALSVSRGNSEAALAARDAAAALLAGADRVTGSA